MPPRPVYTANLPVHVEISGGVSFGDAPGSSNEGSSELKVGCVGRKLTDMKTLTTRDFTRDFAKVRHELCAVTESGKVIGTWTPLAEDPEPMDFAARVREDFSKPLPFTGTELLKRGKKR